MTILIFIGCGLVALGLIVFPFAKKLPEPWFQCAWCNEFFNYRGEQTTTAPEICEGHGICPKCSEFQRQQLEELRASRG
jgi:hypothetical protein